TLSQNYYSGYETARDQVDGERHFVGSFDTYDLQVSYSGFKNWRFAVGAKNLLDRDPHLFIPTANAFQYGYDPSVYDPRGRFVYGQVTYSFK
ncbi:MAG: TonB-dependent receptor, partial [Casimicrobiaceae bacterium]